MKIRAVLLWILSSSFLYANEVPSASSVEVLKESLNTFGDFLNSSAGELLRNALDIPELRGAHYRLQLEESVNEAGEKTQTIVASGALRQIPSSKLRAVHKINYSSAFYLVRIVTGKQEGWVVAKPSAFKFYSNGKVEVIFAALSDIEHAEMVVNVSHDTSKSARDFSRALMKTDAFHYKASDYETLQFDWNQATVLKKYDLQAFVLRLVALKIVGDQLDSNLKLPQFQYNPDDTKKDLQDLKELPLLKT